VLVSLVNDLGRRGSPGNEGLSDRELEVLRLLATELTGPEIARHLFGTTTAPRH
jgi:LuxR family maltose regulon positive regulatory protein